LTVHGLADQAPDQIGGQGFLPRPPVVGAGSLGFSSIAPLQGGAGLGSLASTAAKCPGFWGCGVPKIQGKITFQRNLCYRADERIRLGAKKNFGNLPRE